MKNEVIRRVSVNELAWLSLNRIEEVTVPKWMISEVFWGFKKRRRLRSHRLQNSENDLKIMDTSSRRQAHCSVGGSQVVIDLLCQQSYRLNETPLHTKVYSQNIQFEFQASFDKVLCQMNIMPRVRNRLPLHEGKAFD